MNSNTIALGSIFKRSLLFIWVFCVSGCHNEPVDALPQSSDPPLSENIKLLKKMTFPDNRYVIFTYTDKGVLDQYAYFFPNENAPVYTTNIYYKNGLLWRTDSFNQQSQPEFEEEYFYSDNKLVEIKAINHVPDTNHTSDPIIIQLIYTENNVTKVIYDGVGVAFQDNYSYDPLGNIESMNRSYISDNQILSSEETNFTYDDGPSHLKSINPILWQSKFADFEIKSNINNIKSSHKKYTTNNDIPDTEITVNYTYDSDNYPTKKVEITPWGNREYKFEYYE